MPTDSTFNPKWRNGQMTNCLENLMCTRPRAAAASSRAAAGRAIAGARAARRAVRPRSICPSTTMETLPVSSDTTIATESFSSVRPIAARCRDPSSLLNFGFTVSGRKQAAAAMRSSCTMTAPSCSGDWGRKMLCSRS